MNIQAQVGKQTNSNGANPTVRANAEGDIVISENFGRYCQKTLEGDAYVISTPSAGVTLTIPNTAFTLGSSSIPIITIVNGGTRNISINKLMISTVSGPPAAGTWWWAAAVGQTPSAFLSLSSSGFNTKTWVTTTDLGASARIGIGQGLTGLNGSLSLVRIAGNLDTVTAGLGTYIEEIAGSIIIPPNGLIGLLAPAVGTNHVVHASVELITI